MSGSETQKLETAVYQCWQKYNTGNTGAIEEIYSQLMPFCLRICSRTCGRYIDESDEEASIARMSILEAFERYEPNKGYMLIYLGQVIHHRLIDYKRNEKRSYILPVENLDMEPMAEDQIEAIIEEIARIQEIKQFKLKLISFGIEFNDLAFSSPRQEKTRNIAKNICLIIANDEEMQSFLLKNKKLPIKLLVNEHQQNRKLIDRYRKYIIAGSLILINDFTQLKSFIWRQKGGA